MLTAPKQKSGQKVSGELSNAPQNKPGIKVVPAGDRIEKFLDFFHQNAGKVEQILYGGSGGAKSHSTCQHLVEELFNTPDLAILITRKTGPALRATTWRMIREILDADGYIRGKDYEMNITSMEIKVIGTSSFMLFTSVDDPQKLKSSAYNIAYVEEITEFTPDDVFFIRNTLRRPRKDGRVNQLIMTFNPVAATHWVWQRLVIAADPVKTAIIHSTHWDNPFLPDTYRADLEGLINQDENKYRVYTLGEPGVVGNLIYTNYSICRDCDKIPGDDISYGLDFGFNNQTGLIECKMYDGEPYWREIIYQSHLTNSQLIDLIKQRVPNLARRFYCDSAEPARIAELRMAGINAMPADKNVLDGINYIKTLKLHIDYESPNLIKEIQQYSYAERGGVVMEEPVKFLDHLLDGARYAIFSQRNTGTRPFNPEALKRALNPDVKPLKFAFKRQS